MPPVPAFGASLATTTPGTAATAEFTLGRKCTSMRATYALTDSSLTGSSGAVTVSADGKILSTHSLAVGTIEPDVEISVKSKVSGVVGCPILVAMSSA